jgi:hypothetical protein
MAFELYGLLGEDAPDITLDSLASYLVQFFSRTDGFQLEREEDPFSPSERNLHLTWNEWWTRVFLESGPDVLADSAAIAESATQDRQEKIGRIDRLRVLCADDENQEHTNHVIFMMDFLGRFPASRYSIHSNRSSCKRSSSSSS